MSTTTLVSSRTRRIEDLPLDLVQPRGQEDSRQVLMAGLDGDNLDAKTVQALKLALKLLETAQPPEEPDPPKGESDGDASKTTVGQVAEVVSELPPQMLRRAVITLCTALALVAPVVEQLAANMFGSSTIEKLDTIIQSQVATERNFQILSSFVVQSENARREGKPLPPIPPMMTLMAAQDEVERTSGR